MNFKKYQLLTLCIFFVAVIFGQTYSSVISDKEITDFIDWELNTEKKISEESKNKPKQLFITISKWDTSNFLPGSNKEIPYLSLNSYIFYPNNKWLDTIFSTQDREFLFNQFNSQIEGSWKHQFTNTSLTKKTKQRNPNRYYLSLPLFSVDRKYVIIKRVYYCGTQCAYRGIYIYKNIRNKEWLLIGSLNTSTS